MWCSQLFAEKQLSSSLPRPFFDRMSFDFRLSSFLLVGLSLSPSAFLSPSLPLANQAWIFPLMATLNQTSFLKSSSLVVSAIRQSVTCSQYSYFSILKSSLFQSAASFSISYLLASALLRWFQKSQKSQVQSASSKSSLLKKLPQASYSSRMSLSNLMQWMTSKQSYLSSFSLSLMAVRQNSIACLLLLHFYQRACLKLQNGPFLAGVLALGFALVQRGGAVIFLTASLNSLRLLSAFWSEAASSIKVLLLKESTISSALKALGMVVFLIAEITYLVGSLIQKCEMAAWPMSCAIISFTFSLSVSSARSFKMLLVSSTAPSAFVTIRLTNTLILSIFPCFALPVTPKHCRNLSMKIWELLSWLSSTSKTSDNLLEMLASCYSSSSLTSSVASCDF